MLLTLRKRWAWCSIFTQSADFSINRSFQPILLHLLRCLSVTYHYSHKIRTRYKNYPLRSALICDTTQHRVVIPYRRFGTTYRLFLQGQAPWRWDRWVAPETLVRNCHTTLHSIPDDGRSHLHLGGSLKSRNSLSPYPLFFGGGGTLMLLPHIFAL